MDIAWQGKRVTFMRWVGCSKSIQSYRWKNFVQKVGANEMFIGINGMRQHLVAVKCGKQL
ncbi:hypothetical protein D3Z62_19890 [Lachnospiraceae bacterium]|nr:hypothetical protein [Lachnospiraceae bacterium]